MLGNRKDGGSSSGADGGAEDEDDALSRARRKVDGAAALMRHNVDAALQNVASLTVIELHSADLMTDSAVFRDRARELRRKLWWREMRMKLAAAAFVLLVLGAVIAVAVVASSAGK